jgi:hypothetical protein
MPAPSFYAHAAEVKLRPPPAPRSVFSRQNEAERPQLFALIPEIER